MRFQKHLIRRDENAGGDKPGGEGGGAGTPSVASKPARPDELPEDLWDAEAGSVKMDALLPRIKAQGEFEASLIGKPEDIDWALPADLDPDAKDVVYEINTDDPMVKAFAPELVGVPKATASKLITAMARFQLQEAKAAKAAIQAEEKKLGEKYTDRITGAQAYVESVVGKEKAARFRNTWVTAEQVEIIEALAKHASGPRPAPINEGGGGTETNKGRVFYGGMGSGGAN